MHTNDQYQVPVKMRKRSKNSIVFDVTRFLLSKTTYDSKPWVVGYVRKRCHRLMKDLITTWYAQGYLTKTRNIFQKSLMFKDCWERAQEQLVRLKSDESNILGNEELFAKVSLITFVGLYCSMTNLTSTEKAWRYRSPRREQ